MRFLTTPILLSLIFFSAAALRAQSVSGINIAGLPVTDAERSMKTPIIDKDAGVEALFWRVHVIEIQGQDAQRILYHYVRLKVFNEKGKSQVAAIDIPFSEENSIDYVAGRTIKADGAEVELKKESICRG